MSQENIKRAKAAIPQDTDIVALIRDEVAFGRIVDAADTFFTDDFENVVVLPAQRRAYAGVEGLRANWLDWLEPWASYRVTIDELIDLGDRVLALTRNYGRRKDMEAEVEMIAAAILTFRDGKLARWEDYADRTAALQAVER